ncbi:MAG: ribose 5-phosphate isomerase B [Bacteroidota bacterium]
METISLGCDHAGFELKEKLKIYLELKGYTVKDYGTNSTNSVDYPDYIHTLASDINKGIYNKGIIICGSGNGVAITANKYLNVRAALCWETEIAELARKHNDANIVSLPARYLDLEQAKSIIDIFLKTAFENGRHQIRVEKIKNIIL